MPYISPKLKIGARVEFIFQSSPNGSTANFYPPRGTRGIIIGENLRGFLVDWEVPPPDQVKCKWWCNKEHVRFLPEG